jgi:site-specific DNA-adenine methylase
MTLKAPFIWFGGKRRVADRVWAALGDVDQYVEPFAGSIAVLLGRPSWHKATCETVNDADQYLSNFWRALALAPDDVAFYADWPVNEADLLARHLWLVNEGRNRIAKMDSDPDFYDAKVAGWWVWGLNAWIGSGWCAGTGPWKLSEGGVTNDRQLPHLGDAGQGVNRQLPHLGDAGRGVNRQLPHLGSAGQDSEPQATDIQVYFQQLAERLRGVRVCCGDWSRVVTNGALSYGSTVGIFLDPPYLGDVRTADLYAVDDHTISIAVRDWAIENGENPRYRIVLAGYKQEHDEAIPSDWRRHFYSASKAYGTTGAVGKRKGNDANRHNEALWFSPHCLQSSDRKLFQM